jgi:LmbE family N-acetylglucosaminyl deacetylase
MLIGDLRQLDDSYDRIYLAPHLDDAALSCGGAIAQHTAAGGRALVVTLCTAAPPPAGPFSSFAEEVHAEWGLAPDQVVRARLAEDDLALARLGADTYRASCLDAIYRVPAAYNSRTTLFGTPVAGDPLFLAARQLVAELRRRAPTATIYAPLGVGNHVDHQIVLAAALAEAGAGLALYEDYPYAHIAESVERRLAALDLALEPETIEIGATLGRKIESIAAYASQLGALFGGADAMAAAVAEYAARRRPAEGGYGERIWRRAGS